jgi:hypothetical protein
MFLPKLLVRPLREHTDSSETFVSSPLFFYQPTRLIASSRTSGTSCVIASFMMAYIFKVMSLEIMTLVGMALLGCPSRRSNV